MSRVFQNIDPPRPLGPARRENPAKCPSLAKKSAKENRCLYSSLEQLQMALRPYMFLKLGLNNEKSIHTLTVSYFTPKNILKGQQREMVFWLKPSLMM